MAMPQELNDNRLTKDDWLTPPALLTLLGPFDLDPCASHGQPWRTATRQYTNRDDGLSKPWRGLVWLNPPYGRSIGLWMRKLAEHPGGGLALVYCRVETAWFHQHVWKAASAIHFFRGRVKFVNPTTQRRGDRSMAPSCLIAYGRAAVDRAKRLKHSVWTGKLVHLND